MSSDVPSGVSELHRWATQLDLSTALGDLLIGFSRLEAAASESICEFFDEAEYRRIELVAGELAFRKRLDVLMALARQAGTEEPYLQALEKAVGEASRIEDLRNQIVHSHWERTMRMVSGKPEFRVRKVRIQARRKKTVETSELPDVDAICAVTLDAEDAADELLSAAKHASIYHRKGRKQPNQALQTTSMARRASGKVSDSDRHRLGV